MFKLSGTIFTLVLLGSVASFIWYKIYSLNQEVTIITYQLEQNVSRVNQLTLQLAIEKGNSKDLQDALANANLTIKSITTSKSDIENELKKLQEDNLQNKIKNKKLKELLALDNKTKETCEYGIKLNKAIKELKYGDL